MIFIRYFQDIYRIFPGYFQDIYRTFTGYFHNISRVFPAFCGTGGLDPGSSMSWTHTISQVKQVEWKGNVSPEGVLRGSRHPWSVCVRQESKVQPWKGYLPNPFPLNKQE